MASKESIPDDIQLENVEFHRAESMINESVILENIANEEGESTNPVHEYTGVQVRSVRAKLTHISAELIMFICMFSYSLRSTTSLHMIWDKVCQVHLGHSEDTCKMLTNYSIVLEVEKMTYYYQLGHNLLQVAPSVILAFFIGSWSDKCGRKPPLILALAGIIIDGFGTMGCAYFFHSRLEYYLISALFTGLSGGFIGVLMILYSYASDITNSSERILQYATIELAFGMSMVLGELAGNRMLKTANYTNRFTASLCGNILGLLYVVFLLGETTGLNNKDGLWKKFKDFWKRNSIENSIKAIIQKRPNHGREQIWLLVFSMSIMVIGFASTVRIMEFYLFELFMRNIERIQTFSAMYSTLGLFLMLVAVLISAKKNIKDPVLGIIGTVSLSLKNFCLAFAIKRSVYHLANCFGLLSSLGTVAVRARISKVVSKDDFGKVFALTTAAEFLFPIVSTVVVLKIFQATISVFSGLVFLLLAILLDNPIGIFMWLLRLPSES